VRPGAAPVLARVRLAMDDAGSARVQVRLDGWPLLVVDLDARTVRVNDLRRSTKFAHGAAIPAPCAEVGLRTGAVGDELYLLVGEVAAVFVAVGPDTAVHTAVKVVESATGRLLLDKAVRYRQLAAPGPPCPIADATGE